MNQSALNQITKQSGPAAKQNEYQVHYTALIYQVKENDQTLNISVPLAFYNYEQSVASASIAFELTDVGEISAAIEPLASAKAEEIIGSDFHKHIMDLFPTAEAVLAPMQQIHRHPGRLSSFSGTDLDTNPNSPGICFPFLKAPENTPSFGSIIAHANGLTELIHTEYREVHGDIEAKDGIEYLHGKSVTYVKGYDTVPATGFISFFEHQKNRVDSYVDTDGIAKTKLNDSIDKLFESYETLDFTPSVDLVLPDYVKERSYSTPSLYGDGYSGGSIHYHNNNKKTQPVNKYGGPNKNLLEAMMDEADKPVKKSDSDMIEEAIIDQEIENGSLKVKPEEDDSNLLFPVDEREMSDMERAEFADALRDDIGELGVSVKTLALASDDQIYAWAYSLRMITDAGGKEPEDDHILEEEGFIIGEQNIKV